MYTKIHQLYWKNSKNCSVQACNQYFPAISSHLNHTLNGQISIRYTFEITNHTPNPLCKAWELLCEKDSPWNSSVQNPEYTPNDKSLSLAKWIVTFSTPDSAFRGSISVHMIGLANHYNSHLFDFMPTLILPLSLHDFASLLEHSSPSIQLLFPQFLYHDSVRAIKKYDLQLKSTTYLYFTATISYYFTHRVMRSFALNNFCIYCTEKFFLHIII